MNHCKTILVILALVGALHCFAEDKSHGKMEMGSISKEAIVVKNFVGFFKVFEKKYNGDFAASMSDFERVGIDIETFAADMGIDFENSFFFVNPSLDVVQSFDAVPVFSNSEAIDYQSNGKLGHYVIWRLKNGDYSLSKVPKEDISELLAKYGSSLPNLKPNIISDATGVNINADKSAEREPETIPKSKAEESTNIGSSVAIKQPIEEPSNWRPWLVGALVVAGGIALAVRRKS